METTETPAMPDQSAGGWDQAAAAAAGVNKPDMTAPSQQTGNPSQQMPQSSQAPTAPQPPQVSTLQAPPPTAAPVRPGGIRGFIDRMVDSLAGTDTSRVRQDPQGNIYVQHQSMTRGQQWLRIGAEALEGAAAGLQQKGAGSKGAALGAGIKAGQDVRQQENKRNDQDLLQLANISALNHQIAANALELTRKQVEGQQHDIEFSEKQADRLTGQGAQQVGHAANLQELTKFMRDTPQFNKDQAQTAMYTPVVTYGADGKPNGFDIYKKVPGSDEEMLPKGTEVPFFNPVTNAIEYQKTSGPIKQGDVNALWAAAGNARHRYQLDQAEIDERKANAGAKNNPPPKTETPSETELHHAEAARAWAEAHKDQAAADAEAAKNKETQGPLVDEIGQGKMVPGRLGYLLAKNPDLMNAVAEKYPGFDSSKVDAYVKAYQDFTSGPIGTQLNAGSTVLGHLNELRKLNTTASHVPGTPAWNAYRNKADTVSTELAKFYGDATIPAINAIKSTLTANLPGTRDAAIKTQAESMLDKFQSFKQQWKNAAPSEVYEAKMPSVSPEGDVARAELDFAYKGKASLTDFHTNPQTGQIIGRNGNIWIDAKTGQVVK